MNRGSGERRTSFKKTNIVFVSHEATFTGAPILLLRLMKELSLTGRFQISTLLIKDGPLQEEFSKLGEVFFWEDPMPKSIGARLKNKIVIKAGFPSLSDSAINKTKIASKMANADLIFANTIATAVPLRDLTSEGQPDKKIIFYIHELAIVTGALTTRADMEYIRSASFKVFVPAEAVKSFLITQYQFNAGQIALLKYFFPAATAGSKLKNKGGKFIVGACGSLTPRKGYDIFVQLANILVNNQGITDIEFRWIGANLLSLEYLLFKTDLEKCLLSDHVKIVAETNDVQEDLRALDVLLLPSREDAFPLVVLEAAQYKVPTICFRGAGGITEFVGEGAGLAVDYFDLNGFCSAIVKLKNDINLRSQLGENASEKVKDYTDSKKLVESFIELCEIGYQ